MTEPRTALELILAGRWSMADFAASLYTPEERAAALPAWRPDTSTHDVAMLPARRGQGDLFGGRV